MPTEEVQLELTSLMSTTEEGKTKSPTCCSTSSGEEINEEEDEIEQQVSREKATMELRERIRITLHEQRMEELLQADSGVATFHKFSLACPSHLVCLVMCVWFCVAVTVMCILVVQQDAKFAELAWRLDFLEDHLPRRLKKI